MTVWQDRKPVHVMSTNSQPDESATVRRRNRDGSTQQVPCPPSIVAYNRFMGGVDKSDQLRHYYPVRCKTRKFYRSIFWFLFDSCAVNANIRQITLKNFRFKLAEGMIGEYNSRLRYALPAPVRAVTLHCAHRAAKRRRTGEDTCSTGGHFPVRLPKRSKCTYCLNVKRRRYDSYVWCRQCGKALCMVVRDSQMMSLHALSATTLNACEPQPYMSVCYIIHDSLYNQILDLC